MSEVDSADLDVLVERVRNLNRQGRVVLGLTGGPGAGKSTLAASLASELGADAVVVPMDGFHLAQAVLHANDTADVKGAPQTFDGYGYIALLRRLRRQLDGEVIYAPTFSRDIEEPIGSAIPIRPDTRYVITEGNYLLLDTPPWAAARGLLDEIWFLDPGDRIRINRLVRRHVQFGRTELEALRRATSGSDAENARMVAATRDAANLVVLT